MFVEKMSAKLEGPLKVPHNKILDKMKAEWALLNDFVGRKQLLPTYSFLKRIH